MSAWTIPLSDVDLGPEEEEAVLRVIRSRWLTLGAEVQAFEQEFAAACGAPGAVALSSCTAALHLACVALGVRAGVEVIVPTMTFVATANAVTHAGGTPVLADSVGGSDFSLDVEDVRRRITPSTRGVICVHYGGSACDMDGLMRVCDEHGLFLIEDAAHSPGGSWEGRALGTIGDAGCFSFFGNKNMTTGEGGMVIARDPGVLERVRLFRSHGMTSTSWDRFKGHAFEYDVVESGYNYRPTELAGALGRAQLSKLAGNNERRRELLRRYASRIGELPELQLADWSEEGSAHLAVVLASDEQRRNLLRSALTDASVQTSMHYPPIHLFGSFRERYGYDNGSLPAAEDLSSRAITLPLHAHMSLAQVDYVCDVLAAACSTQADHRGSRDVA